MSGEKSSAKLIAELCAEGYPSGSKKLPGLINGGSFPVDITKTDSKFGILCLLTFFVGIGDAIISFCFSVHITLIITGVIWLVTAFLWCLMAMKFRRIAYESECRRMNLSIQDTIKEITNNQKGGS